MAKIADWDDRIGRRLRLRDLRVFFAVVQLGSLSKAAEHLRVTHPAVSQVIADLEHVLGVKLFDRNFRGVEPTLYARALLARGQAAFDELRQGIRDIEFLADPTAGELTIGYSQSIADTFFPQIVQQFFEKYPRVVMHADIVPTPSFMFPGLHDRTYDLVLTRVRMPLPDDKGMNDLNVEVLFDDPFVLAASIGSPWARRRKIDIAELLNEPWLLPRPETSSYEAVAEAFKARGLKMPVASLVTYAMDLRAKLAARTQFLTVVSKSVVYHGDDRLALKELAVDIPMRPWPHVILTLKDRTLSPVVGRFIDSAREVAKAMATNNRRRKI